MMSIVPSEPLAKEEPSSPETAEFEIVMGRRQIASMLFVTTVIVVACSAISFLAGKTASPRQVLAAQTPVPVAVVAPAPVPKPQPPKQEEPPKQEPVVSAAPLLADPVPGALYIQTGAVDKGVAMVIAEGLRTHHLQAFVAPGPSEKIFRVLIGPLADSEAYARAKTAIDGMGLNEFTKRYQP